jgi:alcohol dehydrogenase class IV
VDEAVRKTTAFNPKVIVAIGGGSVLDAGKAISAMIPLNEPVKNYLEGIGSKIHPGIKIPFISLPTTAGTGSEAARNAVLSETGLNGFKKSLRHNNFVPNVAIVDPMLAISCPPATTAASGMDTFTQLLESFLSPAGNVITDVIAVEGLRMVSASLLTAYNDGTNLSARTGMALAAYLSGITLTNAGLGLIHGFASSIGAFFPIPHGVICSALMGSVNKLTVRKLRFEKEGTALNKYAVVGRIFCAVNSKSDSYYIDALLDTIESYRRQMKIPTLAQLGVTAADFDRIVKVTDNKNNPTPLAVEEMLEALEMAG